VSGTSSLASRLKSLHTPATHRWAGVLEQKAVDRYRMKAQPG